MSTRSDTFNLYAARAARGFGDGFAAIILPAYLIEIGLDPFQIGVVATAALLGSAAMTLAVGVLAPHHDLRTLLLLCAALMVATGIAIPSVQHIAFMALIAFVGTINPTTGDIGVHVPLEQAALAHGASDQDRTRIFARYSLIGALSIAAGALAAACTGRVGIARHGQDRRAAGNVLRLWRLRAYRRPVLFAPGADRGAGNSPAGDDPGAVAPHRLQAGGPVQPRFFRRRVRRAIAAGALAVRALRALACRRQRLLLLVQCADCLLLSDRGAARGAVRARQHHGVHPHSLEHLPHPGGVFSRSHDRPRPAAGALGAVADGRADAHVLRDGSGHSARAGRCRQHHRGPAQSSRGDQPHLERRVADDLACRPAAGDLRRAQDRL